MYAQDTKLKTYNVKVVVHYDKAHKKILKAYHIPVQLLAPEKCNKDGEIEAFFKGKKKQWNEDNL